jgi:hypothetical protein
MRVSLAKYWRLSEWKETLEYCTIKPGDARNTVQGSIGGRSLAPHRRIEMKLRSEPGLTFDDVLLAPSVQLSAAGEM